ncbi:hypothetical protein LZ30DRAFT_714686, partial [Colletotrichum cereale]
MKWKRHCALYGLYFVHITVRPGLARLQPPPGHAVPRVPPPPFVLSLSLTPFPSSQPVDDIVMRFCGGYRNPPSSLGLGTRIPIEPHLAQSRYTDKHL